MLDELPCQICGGPCIPLDVMDFNRSGGAESKGIHRPLSGIPVYYYLCRQCGFCFAPEICKWSMKDFSEKIYNKEYIEVDPDFDKARPEVNASDLTRIFAGKEESIRHLDYGGGNGQLSYLLAKSGWDSLSYDPMIDSDDTLMDLKSFNLITAFEVFEHVPDVNFLMTQLDSFLADEGLIMFSTLISDGNIMENQRLNWWYASPRNGHISLFSRRSLVILANKYQFKFGSFSKDIHVFFRKVPQWAEHIFNNQKYNNNN